MDQRRIYARPVDPAPWEVVEVDRDGNEMVRATTTREDAIARAASWNADVQAARRAEREAHEKAHAATK